jgi:hypothetical protein
MSSGVVLTVLEKRKSDAPMAFEARSIYSQALQKEAKTSNSVLLGNDAETLGNGISIFRGKVMFSSSRVEMSKSSVF